MPEITVRMELERITKNTYRFSESNNESPSPITTIYISKWAFIGKEPSEIEITISGDELKG